MAIPSTHGMRGRQPAVAAASTGLAVGRNSQPCWLVPNLSAATPWAPPRSHRCGAQIMTMMIMLT
eukprot:10160727-Karenia_brevis.AAC.1